MPSKLSSDNGTHFINKPLLHGKSLGLILRRHFAYHSASGGAVERENGTLKSKLTKCCAETGLPWTLGLGVLHVHEDEGKDKNFPQTF